jgi:hypothetical protein
MTPSATKSEPKRLDRSIYPYGARSDQYPALPRRHIKLSRRRAFLVQTLEMPFDAQEHAFRVFEDTALGS